MAKIKVGKTPNGVVYAFRAIWVADLGRGMLVRVDPRNNRITARIPVDQADWITASPDALWVSSESGEVVRVDPTAGAVVARVRVGANPLASAWIDGELWVPNIDDGTVSIVDPARNAVRTTLSVGREPLSVAFADGDVWVSDSRDGELLRLGITQ